MKFIYCDETNMETRDGDFLIYGGLTVDDDKFQSLNDKIWLIREKYKIDRSEKLKFNPGPKHLLHQEFIGLKSELIEAACDHACQFLVYHVLHDLVTDADLGRRNGINEICLNFSYLLKAADTCGMVLLDRFNDLGNKIDGHLTEKFSIGLTGLPHSEQFRLDRVVGLHYSAIGQSHMPSLIDIILGSYRFALNSHCRNEAKHHVSAGKILKSLRPLFPSDRAGAGIPRISISFSPLDIRVPPFKVKYTNAIDFLRSNGLDIQQKYD
ncbi:hypothetical protein MWU60_07935 [Yoonia sp. F2084L]|uniref:hypothetical protein n=1 Tax=Yoonia sp. F2084L TaxID=2926419 RepID=UPI001FF2D8E2|nr:hypothetical protein [Yoonia sp. F2084L]MCK0095498.1 hypothetical protein [Yoonia sp. F2084L]